VRRVLEEEKNVNEKLGRRIGELEKELMQQVEENSRVNEKSHKSSFEIVEVEKEKDFYRRKCEELQRKVERQSVEFNEALKAREDEIEALQTQKNVSFWFYEI
jgi:hypothetical protein